MEKSCRNGKKGEKMKKLLISAFLLLATATSTFALTLNEAKTQDKPIVVMFHQQGCGACRKMSPIFDRFASKFSGKFNFVKEDASSGAAAGLSFDTVPALFIMQPKTQKATRISDDCAWDSGCFTKTLQNY